MVKIVNNCCGCANEYPCLGDSCLLRHQKEYYCDNCGDEVEVLYYFENKELCIECIEKSLEMVE